MMNLRLRRYFFNLLAHDPEGIAVSNRFDTLGFRFHQIALVGTREISIAVSAT